jgi:hypothetical protein
VCDFIMCRNKYNLELTVSIFDRTTQDFKEGNGHSVNLTTEQCPMSIIMDASLEKVDPISGAALLTIKR